ncbi:radical SAM protein [Sesbania bispinosa]|nr:radical SAM protein [Sesbania bispinosa]
MSHNLDRGKTFSSCWSYPSRTSRRLCLALGWLRDKPTTLEDPVGDGHEGGNDAALRRTRNGAQWLLQARLVVT